MTIIQFPPINQAHSSGILAVGGDLEVDSLLLAYRSGIFPWPIDEGTLAWFAPPKRAILWLKDFHIPRSLKREINKNCFACCFDKHFAQVIKSCAEPTNRGKQQGTWITPEIIGAYIALHHAGFCHSIECYKNDSLVGGLYGVSIGGFFAGESMFYRTSNASKLALCYLVNHLKSYGVEWLDCQVMTPHMRQLGAVNVSRRKYMQLLEKALLGNPPPFQSGP